MHEVVRENVKTYAEKHGFVLIEETEQHLAYHKLGRRGIIIKMVFSIQAGKGYIQLSAKIDNDLVWSFGDYDWEIIQTVLLGWKS